MNDVIGHYAQQVPLGLLAGDAYVSRRIRFEAGDIFLLPTDGAVELGEERKDFNGRYPSIVQGLAAMSDETVIDGEIVAMDESGRP